MTTTVEQICNQALAESGSDLRIGDIFDGSVAARIALEVYSQTRDDILRGKDWPFARRTVALTLLKNANLLPPGPWDESRPVPPWHYEYAYPSDCLYVRAVRPDPQQYEGGEGLEPGPTRFAIASDFASKTATMAQKVILTDQEKALAVYTARISDLDQWEPLSTSALVDELARIFRDSKVPISTEQSKVDIAQALQSADEADKRRG